MYLAKLIPINNRINGDEQSGITAISRIEAHTVCAVPVAHCFFEIKSE